jgi:hypothetical protein
MKKEKTDKIATTIRVDEIPYEKSKIIAVKELRSANAQLEYFITKGVEDYEKANGEITLSE